MPGDLKALVREVPDFPTRGIGFKDIMPLLADADALHEVVARMTEWGRERSPEVVVGGEARGFLLGSALAYELGCGFVPARRPGKLPPETISAEYSLEYGTNVSRGRASSSTTTCSRPAGPPPRWPGSSSSWAARSSGSPS